MVVLVVVLVVEVLILVIIVVAPDVAGERPRPLRVLEFFAGIGGMRAACALSGLEAVPMRGGEGADFGASEAPES